MAKLKKPSSRSIAIYNELVAKQNEVRNTLKRIHKHAEETLTAGRLPALVIPKRARKLRQNYFSGLSKAELRARLKKWWAQYRRMKEMFAGGINTYLKTTVFRGYKDLWTDQIGQDPNGYFGRYSEEQIKKSDMGHAMEVYNMLFTHGSDFFMALLYTGKVTEFKYIYDDLVGKVEKNYYLDDQIDKIKRYLNPANRKILFSQADKVTGNYRHSQKAINKAKKLEKKAEEDEDN